MKTGCQLLNLSTEAFCNDLVRKAKIAIGKRGRFKTRERLFIRLPLVIKLMGVAQRSRGMAEAMLYLVSYVFLLSCSL